MLIVLGQGRSTWGVEITYVAETVGQERHAVEAKCVTPLQLFSCDSFISLITLRWIMKIITNDY